MQTVKILIVEDNIVTAEDIATKLKHQGYEITEIVWTGTNALKSVQNNTPDFVIMDINLEGEMDGIETVKKINEINSIPFIYLTAFSDKTTVSRAKNTFPGAYLVKPFKKNDLFNAIEIATANFTKKEIDTANVSRQALMRDFLFIKTLDSGYKKIAIGNILYIEAAGSYINIITLNKKYTHSCNLSYFQTQIEHPQLMRVHRSYIINLNNIIAIDGNRVVIGKEKIPIGKNYLLNFNQLKQKFNIL